MGGGADAEDEVAGVGAAEGFGFAVGVELGEVDFEEFAFVVPADGVDLVAEVQGGEFFADPAAVGVVFGAVDVEALGEVEGEEAFASLEVVEEGPGAGGVDEGDEVGEEGDLEGGAVDEEAGVPVEGGALVVEGGAELGEGWARAARERLKGPTPMPARSRGSSGLVVSWVRGPWGCGVLLIWGCGLPRV